MVDVLFIRVYNLVFIELRFGSFTCYVLGLAKLRLVLSSRTVRRVFESFFRVAVIGTWFRLVSIFRAFAGFAGSVFGAGDIGEYETEFGWS